MPGAYLLQGDARALPLADTSIQCVVTSPPYWGLRDYGLAPSIWGGDPDHAHAWGAETIKSQAPQRDHAPDGNFGSTRGTEASRSGMAFTASQGAFCPCGAWRGVLGLEPTPELYVAHLVEVFREVRRVLRDDGTCWLNLGDSYATGAGKVGDHPGGGAQGQRWKDYGPARAQVPDGKNPGAGIPTYQPNRMPIAGLKPKDLCMIPARVAMALQADGWWLRSDIVWSKPNPMPESITDRPTKAHEYVFLLTKSARYYYDAEAIKEPANSEGPRGGNLLNDTPKGPNGGNERWRGERALDWAITGRNRRSVWEIATQPYPEAHFATFPEKLVEPCILAGTSERGACPACGAGWAREVATPKIPSEMRNRDDDTKMGYHTRQLGGGQAIQDWRSENPTVTLGWSPTCDCPPADPVPCRVLDPFSGSGTTVAVAERLGRVGIGVELKPDYLALARKRTVQAGLL